MLAAILARHGFFYEKTPSEVIKNTIVIEIKMKPWLKWLTGAI